MTHHGPAPSGRATSVRAAAGFAAPIIAFAVLSSYFCLFGPRVPVAGGMGWDGVHYGRCAIDLNMCLREDPLSAYSIHRLLPSLVVGAAAAATGSHLNARSVTLWFSVMNLVCTMLCLGMWLDICRQARFARATTLFGTAALFFNFAFVRFPFFAPVSTDSVAYLLATLVLWAYVRGYQSLASLAVLPAGFTWPAALPAIVTTCGLRRKVGSQAAGSAAANATGRQHAFSMGVTLASLATFVFFAFVHPWEMTSSAQVVRPVLPLSMLLQAAYVYWVAQLTPVAKFLSGISVRPASLGILALCLCIYAGTGRLLSGLVVAPDPLDMSTGWGYLLTSGLVYPGLFIVALTTFLGPWGILLIIKFPKLLAAAATDDPALFPTVVLAAVFVLDSESRHLTFYLPSVVYVMCRLLDGRISDAGVVAFAWGSLLLSRFWLPMETGPYGDLLQFPAQILFMHIGPWMAPFAYAMGVLQVLVALPLVWLAFRRNLHADRSTEMTELQRAS